MINRRSALKQGTGTLLGMAAGSVLPTLPAQAATTAAAAAAAVVDPSLPVDNGTAVIKTKPATPTRPVGAVAAPPIPVLLSAAAHPKFVNPLPNPLAAKNTFAPDVKGGSSYTLRLRQFNSQIGLVDPITKVPLTTVLWGYAAGLITTTKATKTTPATTTVAQLPTSPGRSFIVNSGTAITVQYENELVITSKDPLTGKTVTTPLQHQLPIDTTLMWANPGNIGGTAPVPLVAHRHGGDQAALSDGVPEAWATPLATTQAQYKGRFFSTPYKYTNNQEAGHLWYHDHALGLTRENVFMGLAGHYIIRDTNETKLNLPKDPYEIALVIQDRMYDNTGKLYYPSNDPTNPSAPAITHLPEFFGDFIIVNGVPWPKAVVEPRYYRLRLLNGSDSRFYDLQFKRAAGLGPALTFYQIGTELGLLNAPVTLTNLLLAPGERADILISFKNLAANESVTVTNSASGPYPASATSTPADPATVGQIMQFQVTQPLSKTADLAAPPTKLRTTNLPMPPAGSVSIPVPANAKVRQLMLFEGKDPYGRLQTMLGTVNTANATPNPATDGTFFFNDPVTEKITLNSTEVWEIYNSTVDAHPIHLHLVNFRVLTRQGFTGTTTPKPMGASGSYTGGYLTNIAPVGTQRAAQANEQGRKDTVVCYPGEVTRIMATFSTAGTYVWHCHILSHEDHEMMRPFVVA